MTESDRKLVWHDAVEIGVEGRGWAATARPFGRLPAHGEAMTTEAVWDLGRCAAGLCVHFKTDATQIWAEWEVANPPLPGPGLTRVAHSGLDLYAEHDGGCRWLGAAAPEEDLRTAACLRSGIDPAFRRYVVYLPYVNPVESLRIGVPDDARFEPVPPRTEKPIAYYGTSIVHGHCAGRPGMTHAAQLGRRLGRAVLNLGFSGNARMEPDLARLLAELDPCLWIVDPVPNMWAELIRERAVGFIEILHAACPGVPIVMVEDRVHAHAPFDTPLSEKHAENRAAWREAYDALKLDGVPDLHYVDHSDLIGADGDGTQDGSHPNDLGFYRYAEALEPVLRRVLGE
jgi:hypothetical protein